MIKNTKYCGFNKLRFEHPRLYGKNRLLRKYYSTFGARAAIIAGCQSTSNVLAGKMFDVPVSGTHAHSWVMSYPSELEAFRAFAEVYPDTCLLLVDTYDTVRGIKNAITVFNELRTRLRSFHAPLELCEPIWLQ